MVDEKAANKGLSDQIRACGLFFVCFIILFVIPLIYHNFIFLTCLPMYKVNKASAIAIMIIFHLVLILLLVSYYKTIFTDAGVVPYEMDEAWVRFPAFPACRMLLTPRPACSKTS